MTDEYRMKRIERILQELRMEVEIGMMQDDFDSEQMGFEFIVPVSRTLHNGVVLCQFRTFPVNRWSIPSDAPLEPRLKLVKK